MKRLSLLLLASAVASATAGAACSSSTATPINLDGGADAAAEKLTPSQAATDTLESIYADPGALTKDAGNRGKILKFAKDADISKADLQAKLDNNGYKGTPASSGATVYRVLYQTERGDDAGSPGYSSAKIYIPDTPAAKQSPAVVIASGTRGQAAACAVTKQDPNAKDRALLMAYSTVGAGMPAIITDLAGYANYGGTKNPQSAYALSTDAGRSMLDAARAIRKLFPALSDKVALVGHSLGGHTALSALALSNTYGADATIAAVAVYSPFWIPQRSWGTILNKSVAQSLGLTVQSSLLTSAVAVWYHYGHAEVQDGPGEGLKLFKPEKQAAVKSFVDSYCLGAQGGLDALGVEYITEAFDPALVTSLAYAAPGLSDCDAADATCNKWIKRYLDDRPHMTGAAASVPIYVVYGEKDTTIAPDRAVCGFDFLAKDKANFKVCYKKGEDHSTIVDVGSSDVSAWLLAKTTGAAEPTTSCDGDVTALTKPCASPPPND